MTTADPPILVVDDDPFIVDVLTRYFKSKGYRVTSTTDPEQAMALAEAECPRLILTDLAMPGMDGITLVKAFKAGAITANVPLVLLTGSDKIDDIEKGFAAGAALYLLKPIDWPSAWAKLEPYLKKHE